MNSLKSKEAASSIATSQSEEIQVKASSLPSPDGQEPSEGRAQEGATLKAGRI